MPASLSWMSRPHRFPTTKRPNCSTSSATCGPAASASSTFRIDCAKSKQLADRVVVLRDGKCTGQLSRDQNTRTNLIRLMIGRDVSRFYQRTPHAPGDEVLSVKNLRTTTFPRHAISFSLRAGEVVGACRFGRRWPLRAIGDAVRRNSRRRRLYEVRPASPSPAHLPRSHRRRHHAGTRGSSPHRFDSSDERRANLSLASLRRDQCRWPLRGILNPTAENRVAAAMIELMRIKTASDRQISAIPVRR